MATAEVISIVVDKIVKALDGDAALFESFLKRSRLETEAAALESAIRKAKAERDLNISTSEAELQTLQASLTTKLAEIDAL